MEKFKKLICCLCAWIGTVSEKIHKKFTVTRAHTEYSTPFNKSNIPADTENFEPPAESQVTRDFVPFNKLKNLPLSEKNLSMTPKIENDLIQQWLQAIEKPIGLDPELEKSIGDLLVKSDTSSDDHKTTPFSNNPSPVYSSKLHLASRALLNKQ